MKPTTLVILALATLFFVVGAVLVNSRNPAFTGASGGEPVFVDLEKRINDAAKITVTAADHHFDIVKKGDGWVVPDKYGYPAKFEVVKETLVGLVQLKTIEAKTAEPSLYPRLEVEDVDKKDAKSVQLTVRDGSGQVLANLILGKKKFGRGEGPAMIYVREPGQAQSWLAEGTIERNDDIKSWLQRDLVTLDRGRVREVTVAPAEPQAADSKNGGDKPFVIRKEKPGGGDFTLVDLPADDKLKSAYEVNSIAGALALLTLDDVLPAKDLKPDAKPLRTLTYKSFDGLVVTIALYEQDGKKWAKIGAVAAPTAPAEAETPKPEASKPEATKAGAPKAEASKSGAAAGSEDQAKLSSAEAVKKEADEITARTKDWVYGLAASDLSTIEKKFADLIEPKEKPKS